MGTVYARALTLALLFLPLCVSLCQTLSISSYFVKDRMCFQSRDINTSQCMRRSEGIDRLLECLSVCAEDSECFAAPSDARGACDLLRECSAMEVDPYCGQGAWSVDIYRKHNYCFNEGQWQETSQSCQCQQTVGERCQIVPRTCADVRILNQKYLFVHLRISDQLPSVLVHCLIWPTDEPRLDILRNDGTRTHNKSWADYLSGYKIDGHNFFIGLKNIPTIARLYKTLEVRIKLQNNTHGVIVRQHFHGFTMTDEQDGFSFHFSTKADVVYDYNGPYVFPSLDVGDCFQDFVNTSFSTWDRDSDNVQNHNLAAENGSGWWYNSNNTECNLLGQRPLQGVGNGQPSLKYFRMRGLDQVSSQFGPMFYRVAVSFF